MNSIPLQNHGQGFSYYANDNRGIQGRGGPPGTPVYQIDFNAIASGKMIAMTKRHIKWRFGFANQEALESGKQGIDCRGEEHDVTLIWSVVSGKRMLMSNGRQLLVGVSKGKMFEHTWVNHRGNTLRLVAYSSQPMSSQLAKRQYDLFIDGVSCFVLPKLYEVGLKGYNADTRIPGQVAPRTLTSGRGMLETDVAVSRSEQQEKEDLQRAIQESLEESRRHLVTKGKLGDIGTSESSKNESNSIVPVQETVQQVDLLDLFSEPEPVATTQSNALVQVQTHNSQYQVDPFAQTPFQVPQVVEKSFPTNHGDTFAPFGYEQHVNQNETMNYATLQTPVMSSEHYASSTPQHSENPFDTFGGMSLVASVSGSNVNNTNYNSKGYSAQFMTNQSHNFVQHEQHQMQYSLQNEQAIQSQTNYFPDQSNRYHSQTPQSYQQQHMENFYYSHDRYQAP